MDPLEEHLDHASETDSELDEALQEEVIEQGDIGEVIDDEGAEPMSDDEGDLGESSKEHMQQGAELHFEDDSIQAFFDHRGWKS